MINTTILKNGEYIGMGVLEIISIPHISILESKYNDKTKEEICFQYKSDMGELLSELYQHYKITQDDVSFELLWMTSPVENQTYKANIRLFIIVRSIQKEKSEAVGLVKEMLNLIRTALTVNKYEVEIIDCNEFVNDFIKINDSSIKSLSKEENVVNLQNQMLPYCFTAEHFWTTTPNLDKISNILIDYPNSAISFQLIPAALSLNEQNSIERMAQLLDSLSQGVMEMGNISISSANRPAENYKYYSNSKNGAFFQYAILVYGDEAACTGISSRLYGQFLGNGEEKNKLCYTELNSVSVNKNGNYFLLPWVINDLLLKSNRNPNIWNINAFAPLYRFPFIVTGEEASEFFRLPIGDENLSAGLNVNESGKGNKSYSSNIINGEDNLEIGRLKSSFSNATIGLSLNDLTKHMLVVGTPGCGKTTFSVGVLDRLWKENGIPFLVIEPAKNEYRAMVESIPELQVFTPGKNTISPFVFNPFVPPKNVKLETYKSTLKTAFEAAVSMSTPLDKIFEESINNCYSDFRWLDTYTSDDPGKAFNISDFIKCFQKTFDDIGYTGDAKNIGRAGVVRLQSLVNLFDNYYSVPIEDLLTKPTVIELAAIENSAEKALIISLLLLSILAYVNANYVGDGNLKNVILLEEAHVLLDADTNAGQGDANPSAIAQGLVKRMLAEIRSCGVGIMIADQSPRKVTTDVVALTDIKVGFRLVEATDKQIFADASNMDENQLKRLGKLKPGEAFLFFSKLDEPEEVVTPNYRIENNIDISLSDDGIRSLSTYWNDKQIKLRPYPECDCIYHCQNNCDYQRRMLAKEIARRIYSHNMTAQTKDPEVFKKIYSHLTPLTKRELNYEIFDDALLACVKVQFLRKVKYSTNIKISDAAIKKLLNKVK